MKISVKVIANSSLSKVIEDEIDLFGNRFLKIKIAQIREGGKANKALIDLIADYFNVKKSQVVIISGAFATNKIIRIECSDNLKFKIIAELQQKLKKQNIVFNDVDGIRVDNNKGWWLLRASNTQPVIVARCESNSIIGLDALKSGLVAIIAEFNLKINF